MEIEVKQSNGIFVNAAVKQVDVDQSELIVSYKNGWKPDEIVPFSKCRLVKKTSSIKHPSQGVSIFKEGDIVEAYVLQPGVKVHGWQSAKIRNIKGSFAVVESLEDPSKSDIIAVEECRSPNSTVQLSLDMLKYYSIPVPDKLLEFLRRPDAFDDLKEAIGNVLIEYDEDSKVIRFWTFSDLGIRRARALADFFMGNSAQKKELLERKAKMNKIYATEKDDQYIEEFTIASDLMGLAIGTQGANITRCYNLPGIVDIRYHESTEDEDKFIVKIVADNSEAAEEARRSMEFVVRSIPIPKDMVSRIIGRDGGTIQDIVDNSGVVRVQIGEDDENDPDSDTVSFFFTGTMESVENAELAIQFKLKHLHEMKQLRESVPASKSSTSIGTNPLMRGLKESRKYEKTGNFGGFGNSGGTGSRQDRRSSKERTSRVRRGGGRTLGGLLGGNSATSSSNFEPVQKR